MEAKLVSTAYNLVSETQYFSNDHELKEEAGPFIGGFVPFPFP